MEGEAFRPNILVQKGYFHNQSPSQIFFSFLNLPHIHYQPPPTNAYPRSPPRLQAAGFYVHMFLL